MLSVECIAMFQILLHIFAIYRKMYEGFKVHRLDSVVHPGFGIHGGTRRRALRPTYVITISSMDVHFWYPSTV